MIEHNYLSNFMNSSPPTQNLPDWAHWLAQDADGTWWAFEAEPNEYDHGWYENEVGRCLRLDDGTPNPRWRESLRPFTSPSNKSTT